MRKESKGLNNRKLDKKSILLLIFTIASFVFMVIFFKKGEGVADSLIQKELYSSLGGLFLGLFAVFLLAFISLLARKRVWKVLAIIALIIFSFATLQEMRYVLLLSDDKKLYEQGEFETFVGTPDEVKYDHKNEYLFELHFGDQSFNVHHLKISRSFYKEELEGKQLEIQYLPNSKLPVSLEHGDGFGVLEQRDGFLVPKPELGVVHVFNWNRGNWNRGTGSLFQKPERGVCPCVSSVMDT